MSDNQPSDRPFPTPPFPVGGTHPADIEPQTSWSRGGLRRLDGIITRLGRTTTDLAIWWNDTRPILQDAALDPDERRRHLRQASVLAEMIPIALEGFRETLTHLSACDAMAADDEELATLIDHAMCWDFTWAYRQEDAASAENNPLDDPEGFRAELRRRLQRGGKRQ